MPQSLVALHVAPEHGSKRHFQPIRFLFLYMYMEIHQSLVATFLRSDSMSPQRLALSNLHGMKSQVIFRPKVLHHLSKIHFGMTVLFEWLDIPPGTLEPRGCWDVGPEEENVPCVLCGRRTSASHSSLVAIADAAIKWRHASSHSSFV